MADWAEYGYCASHSRYFWGLRLHLVRTLHGPPVGYALTGAKGDERQGFLDILANTPAINRLQCDGRRQILIGDKTNYGTGFEDTVEKAGIELPRPARKGEKPRPGARFFKPLRQIIESINDTLKGQLNLE